ncbi:MAG: hypothetical protein FWG79_00515 [Bacteroidales bacterium]|nr:hypothetical protein [Bacteroidales bacterium]
MKKIALLLSFIAAFTIVACDKTETFDATAPTSGVWEEVIWISIERNGKIEREQMTWDEMLAANGNGVDIDSLVYIIQTIEFTQDPADPSKGTMQVTTHYGDGIPSAADSVTDCFKGSRRTEYFKIDYVVEPSGKSDVSWISGDGEFKNSNFTDPNTDYCSPQGELTRIYDFSYENAETESPRRMSLHLWMPKLDNNGNPVLDNDGKVEIIRWSNHTFIQTK